MHKRQRIEEILKSMGVVEYDPQVVDALEEFGRSNLYV